MMRSKALCIALALGGMLLLAPDAKAVTVEYITSGTFGGGSTPGSPTFTAPNATVTFTSSGLNTVDVPPASQVSFGTFTTATTATTQQAVSSPFTLTITQIVPLPGGPANFTATLSGTFSMTNSQATVQFDQPLTQIIPLGVSYTIGTNSINGTPGLIVLAPPTTNGGSQTIPGIINATQAIPEIDPGSAASALACLSSGVMMLIGRRRWRAA